MSFASYGTIIPADVNISTDISVRLIFQEDYSSNGEISELIPSQIIQKQLDVDGLTPLLGNYTLNIPTSVLQKGTGIYTFCIYPKVLNEVVIRDCGIIEDSEIKGLIFDTSEMESSVASLFLNENSLAGYIIKYYENNNTELTPNLFRVATGNYKVKAISTSNNVNQLGASLRYVFDQNSTLVFVGITPNGETDIRFNDSIFIGTPNQKVLMFNTFFTPINIEVEVTDVDLKKLYYGIFGDQTVNYDKGIRTFFDENGNIVLQKDEFTIKDNLNEPLKKVSKIRENIDFTETIND